MIKIENNINITLENITNSILNQEFEHLELNKGESYLITWDLNNNCLSLNTDSKDVIYIKNIIFDNFRTLKEDLSDNSLFERLINDYYNFTDEFFTKKQLIAIGMGIDAELDVLEYADIKRDYFSMYAIFLGLKENASAKYFSHFKID